MIQTTRLNSFISLTSSPTASPSSAVEDNRNFLDEPHRSARLGQTWNLWIAAITTFLATLPTTFVTAQDDESSDESNSAKPTISYVVSFDEAKQHYVDVQLQLDNVAAGELELFLPTWTPGSYLIREYSRQIDDISASNGKGDELPIAKSAKNRWTVQVAEEGKVRVDYNLYCREMSVRTNFVDSEFAVLNGAATFLTGVDLTDQEHHVTIKLPSGWQRAVTALPLKANGRANQFTATDFDHLVDSPILVGNPKVYPFTVDGHEHWLVNLGPDQAWDGAQAAVDIEKIVAEHLSMWQTVPYSKYIFMNVLGESGGGLEHDESTLILSGRWTFARPSSYQRWLGTVSHEFFHAWNIRTLRPKVLVKYDYESENYFRSLWIAEGITSYYDTLALVRSGIINQRDYLQALSRDISSLESTPGRQVQSLSESSYDAWIKYYRSDENSRNTEISYYTKGAVVAFLLDMKIREATEGEQSLDDVMRRFYKEHSGEVGYEESDFRNIASEIAGEDLTEWFAGSVDLTKELDYGQALNYLGLEMTGAPAERTGREASDRDREREGSAWLGARLGGDGDVTSVDVDSPAYEAGINVGDELIAINNERVSGDANRVLGLFDVGSDVEVLIARRGQLRKLTMTLSPRTSASWSMRVVKEPSDEQKQRLAMWLKQKTKADARESEESTESEDDDESDD